MTESALKKEWDLLYKELTEEQRKDGFKIFVCGVLCGITKMADATVPLVDECGDILKDDR